MAWVRLDDQAPRNRKMLRAGPAACWLWVCGIAHCQSQLTEGFIADEVLSMIGVAGAGRCRKLADVLVSAGLFHRVDGGYQVHDYLAFNDTREEATARRDAQRDQRRTAGIASGKSRRERNVNEPVQRAVEPPLNPIPSHPIRSIPKDSLESAKVQTGIYDPAHGERAGRLVERYGELFLQHRSGARYRQRPALDWQDALTLVPVWDDARLEKLAVLVLTTDDPWIATTDRGFKIFAMKASWADDRLRAWETEHGVAV